MHFYHVEGGEFVDRGLLPSGSPYVQRDNYISGSLERIFVKERETREGLRPYWYIVIGDGQRDYNRVRYCLSFPYHSPSFKSIILSLASDDTIDSSSIISIQSYLNKRGTMGTIVRRRYKYHTRLFDGKRLNWITDKLPQTEEERMEYISGLVRKIRSRL